MNVPAKGARKKRAAAWRPRGRVFTFGAYELRPDESALIFSYESILDDDTRVSFIDTVYFPGTTAAQWRALPPAVLESFLQSLRIMLGINYWKPHLAPEMRIEGPGLTCEQAEFWNTVYTKGFGEFFFRAQVDFRGLVAFPIDPNATASPTPMPNLSGVLLANGAGKDTAVSAELLKDKGIPFDLFAWDRRREQYEMARVLERPMVVVVRHGDAMLGKLWQQSPWEGGFPLISTLTLLGALGAALHGKRYFALANERSADAGNVEYLGMDVNHQWSKSTEAEALMRAHIASSISPDIVPLSLLRPLSSLGVMQRFAEHPRYFDVFSSCNAPSFAVRHAPSRTRGYWCGKCAKCAFVFAGLAAFIPRERIVAVAGTDMYADPSLIPIYKRLLGIEGFKPMDCVGEPEEVIVAMHLARERGEYAGAAATALIDEAAAKRGKTIAQMTAEVFATDGRPLVPEFLTETGQGADLRNPAE